MAQMAMVFTLATLYSLALPAPVASLPSVDRGRADWFVGGSAKWASAVLRPFLGYPQVTVVRGGSPSGGTLSSAPGCSLYLEGEITRYAIIY